MDIVVKDISKSVTDAAFAPRKERQSKLEGLLKTQQEALDKQKSGLTDFRTALKDLAKEDQGLLKNQASSSIKEVVTVSANEKALKGHYSFFVKQLAKAEQIAYSGLTDDKVKAGQGTLELTVNANKLNVDLKDVKTVSDLVYAINQDKDNPGVIASVVRTNGEEILLLTSEKTGEKNKVTVGGSAATALLGGSGVTQTQFSTAQDSIVYMGYVNASNKGLEIKNSSNTLDKVINGVTVELIQEQKPGDPLLNVKVDVDPTKTEEQLKKFVDAFNSVKTAINSKKHSGSLSTVLKQQLNNLAGKTYGGKTLGMIGITFDRNGDLKLDSKKLTEVLKHSPKVITDLFSGSDGLVKKLDKSLDGYLNISDGSLKRSAEALAKRRSSLEWTKAKLDTEYEKIYKKNMKKLMALKTAVDKMEGTIQMLDAQPRMQL